MSEGYNNIEELVEKLSKGEFKVPEWQRTYKWDANKERRFLEYVLKYGTSPAAIVVDKQGNIIDGQHRMRCMQKVLEEVNTPGKHKHLKMIYTADVYKLKATKLFVIEMPFKTLAEKIEFFTVINSNTKNVSFSYCSFIRAEANPADYKHQLAKKISPLKESYNLNSGQMQELFQAVCLFTCIKFSLATGEPLKWCKKSEENSMLVQTDPRYYAIDNRELELFINLYCKYILLPPSIFKAYCKGRKGGATILSRILFDDKEGTVTLENLPEKALDYLKFLESKLGDTQRLRDLFKWLKIPTYSKKSI